MAKRLWSNYARCALGANITTTGALATVTLQTGKGALFPSPTGGNWFILAVEDSSHNIEYFKITARSGDICTVGTSGADRAQEGSTARTFTAATSVAYLPVTKAHLDAVTSHMQDEATEHAADVISFTPAGDLASEDVQSALEELDTEKAPLASPALTGTPTAPTAAQQTATTQLATTAFVDLIAPIGTPIPTFLATAPAGFVMAWGTIGNASSGASNRAHADTARLFATFWDNLADAQAAVSGGRGANAAADFAANKTIAIPPLAGRFLAFRDNMSGSSAGRITSAGSGADSETLGGVGGNELLQEHNHVGTSGTESATHTHTNGSDGAASPVAGFGSTPVKTTTLGGATGTESATHTHAITIENEGSGDSQNIPPVIFCNAMFRL